MNYPPDFGVHERHTYFNSPEAPVAWTLELAESLIRCEIPAAVTQ